MHVTYTLENIDYLINIKLYIDPLYIELCVEPYTEPLSQSFVQSFV